MSLLPTVGHEDRMDQWNDSSLQSSQLLVNIAGMQFSQDKFHTVKYLRSELGECSISYKDPEITFE